MMGSIPKPICLPLSAPLSPWASDLFHITIRQICSIKPEDVATVRSSELLAKLELDDLSLISRERRLRWFGHVERSSGEVRTACDIQIEGKQRAGRPKQTWKKLTEKDLVSGSSRQSTLKKGAPADQVRDLLCMQLASTWKGANWCGWCPCTCTLIKNLIMIMMMISLQYWNSWNL